MAAGVLRKGGGLSEALSAAAAAAGPPGREQQQQQHNNNQQQQQHEELAGDWQGAEDGLSDVELELLLAEFAYVEQVCAWCVCRERGGAVAGWLLLTGQRESHAWCCWSCPDASSSWC